jgi:drug/metabolite transporter (DMT)-like permease
MHPISGKSQPTRAASWPFAIAMTSPRLALPLLCGVLACLSWSIGSVLSKIALSTVEPLTLLVGQLAVSSLGLSALSIWLGASIRLGDWRVGLPGLLQPALAYSLSTYGLTMVPATAEAMLFAVETPLVILLAWPMLGESPSRAIGLLCVLAFAGVVVLSWNSEIDSYSLRKWGVALVLAGVFFASLYNIAIRRMSHDVDALRLARASQTVAFLAVGLVWTVAGPLTKISLTVADAALVVTSGLLLQAIPFLLYGITLERISATAAALLLPLVPVFTAVFAAVLLQEMLSARQWLGAATVLLSALGMPIALRGDRPHHL